MKTRRLFSLVNVMAVLLLVMGTFVGCESDDSPDTGDMDGYFDQHPYQSDGRSSTHPRDLSVTPEKVEVTYAGQQFNFRVVGGAEPYRWEVSDAGNGSIAVLPDTTEAVYTANVIAPNTVLAYDASGKAGVADVTGPTDQLVATASPDTVSTPGGRSILTATGGTAPYTWAVSDIALGTIVGSATGNEVVYQRSIGGIGDNTVSCTDGAGTVVNVLIKQP